MQSTLSSGSLIPLSDLTTLETTVNNTAMPSLQKEIQSASSAQASAAQASSAKASAAQASAAQASKYEIDILTSYLNRINAYDQAYILDIYKDTLNIYTTTIKSWIGSISSGNLISINNITSFIKYLSDFLPEVEKQIQTASSAQASSAKAYSAQVSSAQASSAQASSAQASSAQASGAAIPMAQYNTLTEWLNKLNNLTTRYLSDSLNSALVTHKNTVISWANYSSSGNIIPSDNFTTLGKYIDDFIVLANMAIQSGYMKELSAAQASAAQASGAQASAAQASAAQASGVKASVAQASAAEVFKQESNMLSIILSSLKRLDTQYLSSGSQTTLNYYIDSIGKLQSTLSSGALIPDTQLITLLETVINFVKTVQIETAGASAAQASAAQGSAAQGSAAQASAAQASAAQASAAQASAAQASAAKIPQYGEDTVSYGEQETAYGENPEVIYGEAQATYGEAPVNNTEAAANTTEAAANTTEGAANNEEGNEEAAANNEEGNEEATN